MKVTIYIKKDHSVGLFSMWCHMDLPLEEFESDAERENVRNKIKELYEYLDNEGNVCKVTFNDEPTDNSTSSKDGGMLVVS